jgi:hypothetical protein
MAAMTGQDELPPLLGQSRPFLDLMEQVSRVAPLDLVGEREATGFDLVDTTIDDVSRDAAARAGVAIRVADGADYAGFGHGSELTAKLISTGEGPQVNWICRAASV